MSRPTFTVADACKFCGATVDLDNEGNTYRDGTAAHEACADNSAWQAENEPDFD